MEFLRAFFKRITDDLKQKKLIPLKILFFVHASTILVLYPYLTIHMRELGINVEEAAIMSAVTPAVSIVMPPLAGMLADKIGNFRLLLAFLSSLGGISALLLLAVPVGRVTVVFPSAVELLATCQGNDMQLEVMQKHPCLPLHPYSYDINVTDMTCGFVCDPSQLPEDEANAILHTSFFDVHLQSTVDSQHFVYRHAVLQTSHAMVPKKDQSTSRILLNDPYFNTTIFKLSNNKLFFPTPRMYEIECSHDTVNETCIYGQNDIFKDTEDQLKGSVLRMRISHDVQTPPIDIRSYFVKAVTTEGVSIFDENYDGIDSVTCKDNFGQNGVYVQAGRRKLSGCVSACAISTPREGLCENNQELLEIDASLTFWSYLAVRVFIGIISGTASAMFEGAVIAILREHKADYGMQKVYGILGGMISSPLSGILIDYASRGKGYTDFRPAFYLYAVLKIASGIMMLSINLEFKEPAHSLLKDVVTVFKNIELGALFTACFVLGTAWGYIESFLFWLLQDLGATRSLMGITVTVGGVAGLPLLVLSGPIINRLGHANVLFIGFIFYAIRLLGYSLIYDPWLCLIFEAMEAVTSSLSFTAAVTYAARLSTTTTDTSVQGLLGGLYYGVGKGSGSLIGGYLMKFFGTRPTFQIFAGATLITGCFYYVFNTFYLRKRSTIVEDTGFYKKKQVPSDIECSERKTDKELPSADGANNTETKLSVVDKVSVSESDAHRSKLAGENADGGSDSGVDNPSFNENETTVKRDEPKVNG